MNVRHAALVVVVAGLTLVVSGLSATAATHEAHGYWYRAQTGLLAANMPPPPGVPEDGLAVSAGFEGTTEVSAVRYQLEEDETDPVLTLEVAEDNGGDVAAIDACPAQGRWKPAHAGRWDDRPTCEEDAPRVAGARSEDGATWIWDLGELVGEGGLLDVVLEPGSLEGQGEQAPTSSSFRVTFAAPQDASLRTTTDTGTTGEFEPPPVEQGAAPPPETADAPESGSAAPPAVDSGGFSGAPGAGTGSAGEAPQGEPPPVAADPVDPAPEPEEQAADDAGAAGGLPADQLLALLAIAAAGLYAVDVRHRAARPPRRLGPLAGRADDADADGDTGGDRVEEPAPLV